MEQWQPVHWTSDWLISTGIITPTAATGDPMENSIDRFIDRSLVPF